MSFGLGEDSDDEDNKEGEGNQPVDLRSKRKIIEPIQEVSVTLKT